MYRSDLNVYRFVKIKYRSGHFVSPHTHSYFHCFYIVKGKGTLIIDGVRYDVSEEDIYLVQKNVEHAIYADQKEGFLTFEVKFIVNNHVLENGLRSLPYQMHDYDGEVYHILRDMLHEVKNKQPFYEDVINTRFAYIIIYLLRAANNVDNKNINNNSITEVNDDYGVFDEVIKYIKSNLDKKISISELANIVAFSETYFCTLFKKNFNITPGQYINLLKLQKSEELMISSGMNITEIAFALGFKSVHYFSRFFKQHKGCSPYDYMRNINDNLAIQFYEINKDSN